MEIKTLKQNWNTHNSKIIFGVIFVVAAFLRFFHLGVESLWNDELATWVFTTKHGLKEVINFAGQDRSPPLYQIIIYLTTLSWGDSEWALRLPSVFFSLGFLALFYYWAKYFYDTKSAQLACAFVAILYMPIYFSQEARNYSLLLLLSLWSFHQCMLVLEDFSGKNKFQIKKFLLLGLSWTLTAYTHYFGLLLVVAQSLGLISFSLVYKKRFYLTKILIVSSVVGFLYLPWINFIYPAAIMNLPFWIPRPNANSFIEIFQFFFNDSVLLGVVAFFIILSFVGLRCFEKFKERRLPFSLNSRFQIFVFLFVVIVAYIKSIYSTSVFQSKYFIILAPIIYLHLSRSILNLSRSKIITRMLILTCFYGLVIHLFFVINYYGRTDKKEQFNTAFEIMSKYSNVAKDWPMVSFVWNPQYLNYYLQKNKMKIKKGLNLSGDADDIQRIRSFVSIEWLNPNKKIFFDHFWFFSGHRFADSYLLQVLKEIYEPVKYSNLRGVQLILFKSKENLAQSKKLGLPDIDYNSFQKISDGSDVLEIK